jgi:predicted nucleic acid-binding protein
LGPVVLDTTVLIDVLRGHAPARRWLAGLDEVPTCSEISRIEVIRGLRSPERSAAEALFAGLDWAEVTQPIARLAGELGRQYRASHGLAVADLVVAATTRHVGAALATHNLRHYPMFAGLAEPY